MRVNVPQENYYAIFDYKTAGFDLNQLLFYELYYYLIEDPQKIDQVNSFFYFVFEDKLEELKSLLKKKSKQEKIDSLKQDIIAAVNKIAAKGFDLPILKSKLGRQAEITRSDLYLPLMKRFMEMKF